MIQRKQFKIVFLVVALVLNLFCQKPLEGNSLSLALTERQLCDLELLLNGGFEPLDGFMDSKTYDSVVRDMRLTDGTVWPMPIVLDISEKMKEKIEKAAILTLCNQEGTPLAYLEIAEIWNPDKMLEAQLVYGTTSREHPGVDYLFDKAGQYYVGGKVTKISDIRHPDFVSLRRTPSELKDLFKKMGYEKIVAFQTRNPMHRAHVELTRRAAEKIGAHLLLHPAVGKTKPGDVDYFTRVKCYQSILPYYPEGSTTLSLLPIAMRMAGPREALRGRPPVQ